MLSLFGCRGFPATGLTTKGERDAVSDGCLTFAGDELPLAALMPVLRGGAEHGAVLQVAHDVLQPFVALQGDVLRIFVAYGTETAPELALVDAGAAKAAMVLSAV
jgi:hypothetical protein